MYVLKEVLFQMARNVYIVLLLKLQYGVGDVVHVHTFVINVG
jgi:hypothetical protein